MDRMKPVSRIADLREKIGLTQIELAQLLGVTENTIANWEKGRSGLDWIERVIKLCKLFQCSPDQLINYVPDTESEKSTTSKKKRSLDDLRRLINTHEPAASSNQQNFNSQRVEASE
ncbi:MAG: helix-turn-helix transcriptional regulator [Cyanobacteria bacterium P01_G01_bin.49]